MSQYNNNETPQMTHGQEQATKPSYGQNPAAAGAQVAGNQINGQFQAAGDFQGQAENSQAQYSQNVSQALQYQGQTPQNSNGQYQGQPVTPSQTYVSYQSQPEQAQQFQFQYAPQQGQYAQGMQQNQQAQPNAQNSQPTGPFGPAMGTGPNDYGQEPKHEANMFQKGQLLDVLGGIMNGNPDIEKISGLLNTADAQFWKGAAVGAGTALLLGNAAVQSAMAGFVSSILNKNTPENTNKKNEEKK